MLVVKCIKNVEKELQVVNLELERTGYEDQELIQKQKELTDYLEKYKSVLLELSDMESRLYYKIVYEGLNPSRAIEKVAEENYLNDVRPNNPDHIRKFIYKNVKKYLQCP